MVAKRKSLRKPLDKHDPILEKKIGQAKFVLFVERVWPCLWPPVLVICLFALVSLTDIWAIMPTWLHKLSLAFSGLVFIVSFYPFTLFQRPTRKDALVYLEKTAGLKHSVLQSYDDHLGQSKPTKSTLQLWFAHKQKISQIFKTLKVKLPSPRVEQYDPYALRILFVLVLFVAVLAHGGGLTDKLFSAFSFSVPITSEKLRLDAWVTPPEYTRTAPILIHDGSKELPLDMSKKQAVFQVPENSVLIIRGNHTDGEKYKVLLSDEFGKTVKLKVSQKSNKSSKKEISEYRTVLTNPAGIRVLNGTKMTFDWQFNIIEDSPPNIRLTKRVDKTARDAVRLSYHLSDDYGVVSATARFDSYQPDKDIIDEKDPDRPIGKAPEFDLVFPNDQDKSNQAVTHKDLTSHPWAGLPVLLTLSALDEAGQKTDTKPVVTVLPLRKFTKPLAIALIEQRKLLVKKPKSNRALVMQALHALTIGGGEYVKDKAVYLGIRSAFWRLKYNADRGSVASVVDQLWSVALDVESGDLSEAERRMKLAQDKLAQALKEGASGSEIKKLLDELRRSVAEFLQSMQNNVASPKQLPNQNLQQNNQNQAISSEELDRMLRNIENLAKTGARDMASKMLNQLRNVLENLKPQQQARSNAQNSMMSTLENLGDLINRQQKLLDQTYEQRRQNRGDNGKKGQKSNGKQGKKGQSGNGKPNNGLMQQQNALGKALGDIMKKMGEMGLNAGNSLKQAQGAMKDAGQSLGKQQLQNATEQQTHAIDKLRKGAQRAANQLIQQMRQQGQAGNNRDPFGRPAPQQSSGPEFGGRKVKIPEQIDVQRAREILNELRRKFSDAQRPPVELDYLERLLKLF